ncbi:cysteine synthase A [Hominenteromicrobium sp.]|uniref:cysteine synthase A n=1 Tax=Hominenteromicrobium sp. TaxID=3073581 RepID=UPI003A92BCB2
MSVVQSAEALIGNTPLLKLNRLFPGAEIYAKLEYLNPAGSAKDRAAKSMLNDLEARGLLKEGGTVVEPTSGNTGVALAALCAARGYRLVLTMPETMSVERRMLLSAYGAELVLTPGDEGMAGAVKRADEIISATPGAVLAGQFDNPANPAAHERTTGPELWSDLGGKLAAVVAGVGTGGTITGTARYLKKHLPQVHTVGLEPATSPLITQGKSGAHGLQGIGANFIPKNYDASVVDEVLTVTDEEAYKTAKLLARTEGILVGITSGAALAAAVRLLRMPENAEKTLVALLPDSGDRYFSTPIFE